MITSVQKKVKCVHICSVKTLFSLLIFLFSSFLLKAQQVTEVITDFGGYWRSSSTANNATNPNTSHNVLAFKAGTQIYSTGVNNSVLTSKGVAYTTGNFKALPITSITGTVPGPPIYMALAGNYDGVPNGFSTPLPTVKMKDVLTDGINGLDIGTGVTKIPSSAVMTFQVQSIDVNSIADAKPDILYTQIADPTTTNNLDVIYFANSSGAIVGNSVTVNWSTVPSLGTYILDLYNLKVGATCDAATIISGFVSNTTRNIRLTSFKLSDFGITSANAASVTSLLVKPGGESDPAFMAYNSDAFVIIPPSITSQPQTKVVCAGTNQSVTFSVTATGTNDTYQWRKNSVNIIGATNSSYTINPVTASDAGTYEVVVTNSGGTVTSNKAYLNTAITSQPLTQTIVTGNTVTLSVSATNASSFQWKKNGTNITGATDSFYTISPLNTTDNGSYTVSAINTTNSCATVLSSPAVITPVVIVYSKSTPDVNIPSTWGANTDGSGSTPVDFTRSEHTFVLSNRASGNTLTNLNIAGTLDVKNGVAIIADNTTLDVGWCIRTGTGSITGSSSSGLTVRGNSNLYFTPGKQVLKNFTIAGGTVNMLSNLTISGGTLPGKLNLTAGTLALGSNKITIQSTSIANTSMVTTVGSSATVTYGTGGAFIVERFIPAKRASRLLSPAVTSTTSIKENWMEGVSNPDRWLNYNPTPGYGTHITGPKLATDSLDVTQTYNPSLFAFDNNTQGWSIVPNSSGTLTAGSPFRLMVRGSRAVDLNDNYATPSNTILRATGTLAIGTQVVSGALSKKVGGFSFIGNPYACPVNWNNLQKSGIASSYYTLDETQGTRGAYVSYNSSSGTNSSPTSMVDENIQSGQGFFVETKAVSPSLSFTESSKSYTNTSVFRSAGSLTKLSALLLLNLNPGSSNTADGFVAVFGDNFSSAVGFEDSYKFTNLDENMAINRNGVALSIEARPSISGCDTIPIKMWQYRQKEYYLKFVGENFDPLVKASLKDAFLGKETPLDLSTFTTIAFSITPDSASFAPNRFSIVFNTRSALPVTLSKVKASRQDKGIEVAWETMTETNIDRYEIEKSVNMREFDKVFTIAPKAASTTGNTYNWLDNNAIDGNNFYRIKMVDKTGTASYSAVVSVNMKNSKTNVTVYPNPITGSTIGLQLTSMPEGQYKVDISNLSGQNVSRSVLQHSGGSGSQIITLKQKLPAGKYMLQLTNNQTTITKTILVQ
ncbi:MAG: immunoglobulin domain-containing protein [Segetibacter sp.]